MNWDSLIHVAEGMLAPVFVLGGLLTLRNPQSRAEQLARLRLPFPLLLVRLNAAVIVIAGSAFWIAEGTARQEQLAHFIKNVAVLGGLMAMIIAVG